jgi:SHS2 domain-containing protein
VHELFEHTADLGIRVVAPDRDTLFREAAEALFDAIAERSSVLEVPGAGRRSFAIEGRRLDYLLVDWLGELLYVFDTERLLLHDFVVRVDDDGLRAAAAPVPLDPERHRLLHEVKAVTYHRLRVELTDHGWLAEVIVDI